MRRGVLVVALVLAAGTACDAFVNVAPFRAWWPPPPSVDTCGLTPGREACQPVGQRCSSGSGVTSRGAKKCARPRLQSLRGGTVMASLSLPVIEPEVMRSSLQAVSELLTCCGLGVAATRVGLLDAQTTRALAKCVYNVFLPAMLCTSVASTVAGGAGWSLLPLPIAAWLQVGLGIGLSAIILGRRNLKTARGRDVAALSSFGNSGVLPLIFADCLFRATPALHARANALVAMFLLGWSPLCTRMPGRA